MRFEKDWGRLGLKYKEVNLGELVSFVSKGIPPKYIETKSDNTIVVLNQRTNRNFQIDYSLSRLNDLLKKKVPTNKILIDYDILINSTGVGTAGRVAQLVKVPELTTVDGHMIIVRPDEEKIDPLYLGYALKAQQVKIEGLQEGSTGQTELNRQRLLNDIIIQFPESRKLQQDISRLFFSLDEKIENNKKINHHLEQMALSIFKEEFSKKEVTNKLGDFFPVITGKKDANIAKGGEYPFFSCSQNISYTDNYSFDARAILLAGNGDFNVKIFNGKFEAYQRTYVLIPNNDEHFGYLYYAIKYFLNDITSGHRGSVIKFITKGQIEHFDIFMTSNKEKLFLFNSFIENIANNNKEIDKLTNIRDTLLPKLLSGEISIDQASK